MGGGGGTCGVGVPTGIGELGRGRVQRMLARAASKEARFGKQLAVLAFAGSFSATLPEHSEFLRAQPLAPVGVRQFERKVALRTSHEKAGGGAGIRGGRANERKLGNWVGGQ